jgi:hypothetical protein
MLIVLRRCQEEGRGVAVVRAGGVDRVGSRCLGQVGDLLAQKLAVTGEGLYVTSRPCREGAWSSSSIARVSSRRSGVIMNKAIGHDFPLVDPALGHRNEAGREGSLDRGVAAHGCRSDATGAHHKSGGDFSLELRFYDARRKRSPWRFAAATPHLDGQSQLHPESS